MSDKMKPLQIAAETADAYSADAWGPVMWVQAAEMLLDMEFTEEQTADILRSKLTRWARDGWAEPSTYLGHLAVLCKESRPKIKSGLFSRPNGTLPQPPEDT